MKFSNDQIAQKSLEHLQTVVAIDSSSDENSEAIPSTPGQTELAERLATFFAEFGATTQMDPMANLVATLPGRGAKADAAPLALMVHLDTARGTAAVEKLNIEKTWAGQNLPYPANENLQVCIKNYPSLERYRGHDIVFGPGDAPFGLDDKLGLTHLMTLAWLLAEHPETAHVPILFVARPDEEIGRMEAVEGLADLLAHKGVKSGYTIDGLDPFEINVENFNASQATLSFASQPLNAPSLLAEVRLGGVNTHGATAKAEGHRPATRFAAEIVALLASRQAKTQLVWFACDELRDCDAVAYFGYDDPEDLGEIFEATEEVVAPHLPRGASFEVRETDAAPGFDRGAADAIAWVGTFLTSEPGFTLSAEDSDGYQGYSQPYRVVPSKDGFTLNVRLRDFDPTALKAREAHVAAVAGTRPCKIDQQYINMGPELMKRPELIAWAQSAAATLGIEPVVQPIRGGTGVDPFLERGIAVANLGTGYFAPESEKEFTSLQNMGLHALWLFSLVTQ